MPIVLVALLIGAGAYAYYFAWDRVLLDPSQITRYAVGYEGRNLRDFSVFDRPEDRPTRELLLELVNGAELVNETVTPEEGDPLVVLFRRDGLQYHLFPAGEDLAGISEGDRSYVGTLRSAELAELLRDLAASLPEEEPQASLSPPDGVAEESGPFTRYPASGIIAGS
ncbi:MAG: hypothetical protein Kow00129_07010 [Thermoleophilia bacterium]